MISQILALAAAGIAAAGASVSAPESGQADSALPESYFGQLEPHRVAAGVHVLRQPDRLWAVVIGNVTVIEQEDGIVLVDAGGSIGDGRRVAALVRRISPKPVKAVVITHWHNDHPLGLAGIRESWPKAKVIATEAARDYLRDNLSKTVPVKPDEAADTSRLNRYFAVYNDLLKSARDPSLTEEEREGYAAEARFIRDRMGAYTGTYVVVPDVTFTESYRIDDPSAPVEVRFLGRANTDGDAIAWLPKQKILVTGDIVVAPTPYGFNSFTEDWLDVLGKLRAFDFDLLIPGHGAPQTDTAYIDKLIGTLTDVRAQVGPLAAQGLKLEEVQKQVDYADQTRIFAGDDPWARRWFRDYWLNPITASAYREFDEGSPGEAGQ